MDTVCVAVRSFRAGRGLLDLLEAKGARRDQALATGDRLFIVGLEE